MKSIEGNLAKEAPKHERSKLLYEQFEQSDKYTYGSTTVEVFDVQPEKMSTETPVFFGTGWSASRGVYEASILGLADQGRHVVTLFAPHGIDTDPDFGTGDKTYAAAELRKAAALVKTLETKGIEHLDLVLHSESALWGIIVAHMHPEKVRNIVLIDPSGIMDEVSYPRLAVSFVRDIVEGAINSQNLPRPKIERDVQPGSPKDLLGALKNIAGSPIHSLKEVMALRNADIRDMLRELKEQGKHIAIVKGKQDAIYPFDNVKEFLGEEGAYDVAFPMPGTHNEINMDPEEYTESINQALNALQELGEE